MSTNYKKTAQSEKKATVHRKLAAIMFTDMVGYTAMAQRNEAQAVELLEEQRSLLRPIFRKHSGREIDTIGDAFLVEFASSLDAVLCSIDIQSLLKKQNEQRDDERKILLRIGIHLGDVIHKGKNVSGDAVNVASRIEPLALPGGICLTAQVYYSVLNKVECGFESLGNPHLKNVTTPIEVFKVSGLGKASTDKQLAKPTLPKDRIAVLPFANMSPEPSDEYFADGLTEEMINVLSQINGLRIIARTSVNQYKNTAKPISQIADELGVGTILEGSIRKAGNKIRATLQLIDAKSQEHEWSQNYDRSLDDIFEIQSDIAAQVAEKLKVGINKNQEAQLGKRDTDNTEAYLAYLRGRTYLHSRDEASVRAAKQEFEHSLSLDDKFARAYSGLADAFLILGNYQYEPFKDCAKKAKSFVEKALDLDPGLADAHASLALQHSFQGEFAKAQDEYKHSIRVNPGYVAARHWYGNFLMYGLQRFDEAYQQLRLAEEADPLNARICTTMQKCLEALGKTDEAKQRLDKLGKIQPDGSLYLNFAFQDCLSTADFKKALGYLAKIEAIFGKTESLEYLLLYYVATGEKEKLTEAVSKFETAPGNLLERSGVLAYGYAALGNMDKCFYYIKMALEDFPIANFHPVIGDWILTWKSDAILRNIVSDPRWSEIVPKARIE